MYVFLVINHKTFYFMRERKHIMKLSRAIDKFLTALTEEEMQASFDAKMEKKKLENSEIKARLQDLFVSDETYLLEHSIDVLYDIALKHRQASDETLKALFRYKEEE